MKMNAAEISFITLNHSIYSKNEHGRILCEITFPEKTPGEFCIERTYTAEEYIGTELPERLIEAALEKIREQGGRVTAEDPYARMYLSRHKR